VLQGPNIQGTFIELMCTYDYFKSVLSNVYTMVYRSFIYELFHISCDITGWWEGSFVKKRHLDGLDLKYA
jgi:hypothetical protein